MSTLALLALLTATWTGTLTLAAVYALGTIWIDQARG